MFVQHCNISTSLVSTNTIDIYYWYWLQKNLLCLWQFLVGSKTDDDDSLQYLTKDKRESEESATYIDDIYCIAILY